MKKMIFILAALFALSMFFVVAEDGTTYVNITNSAPSVDTIELNDASTGDDSITLTQGTTTTVYCSGTATDADGNGDISTVSSVIWNSGTTTYAGTDDNTNHYTNSSCDYVSGTGAYECTFAVLFYADPASWQCNVTATDSSADSGWLADAATIQQLIAIDIPDGTFIDFGNMNVGEQKATATENITFENEGNVAIDLDIDAWNTGGDQDSTTAMNCSTNGIAIADFRASLTLGTYATYTSMVQAGYTTLDASLARQTTGLLPTTDDVFLGLQITSGAAGQCTGVISLLATADV